MGHVDLDFAYDEDTVEEALARFLGMNGLAGTITTYVVDPAGPGGGWPIVRFFYSTPADLDRLLDAYGLDAEDKAMYMRDAS